MFALKDSFNEYFDSVITYQETAKIVTASYMTTKSKMPNIKQLECLLGSVPENDEIVLRLVGISDSNCMIERAVWEDSYQAFLNEQENEDDEINIELSISKKGVPCNIYSFDDYWKMINKKNLSQVLGYFSGLYSDGILAFQVLNREILVRTREMIFSSETPATVEWNREEYVRKYQEASVFLNRNEIPFIPEDFHVIEQRNGEPVVSLLRKLECAMYLLYIANTSYIAENKLVIQLKVDSSMDIGLQGFEGKEKICELGHWIFSGDNNAVERAGIARNILADKCKTAHELLNIGQDTINAIKSNFVIYQKDTTEQYIETKNRIADNIVELTRQQEEMVQSIVDGLRNNLIAIVTFLITVILAGVDVDKMLQGDSLPYNVRFVTIILIVGSVVYLVASIAGTNFKLKSLERGYNQLKTHYESLLVPDDVNTAFGSTYEETVKRVRKYRNRIAAIWAFFIVAMIFIYIWFAHPELVDNICHTISSIISTQKNNMKEQ